MAARSSGAWPIACSEAAGCVFPDTKVVLDLPARTNRSARRARIPVLVYLSLFLSAGLLVSIEVAGVALLAATLPILLVPLLGGRFVTRWGWRRFFIVAFGIVAIGDLFLVLAALFASPAMRLAATIAGMLTIGVGAALANPQMGNVVLVLAPPTQAGMASAVTMIVRQAGFAISIAALGATLGTTDVAAAFATPFTLAPFVALAAMVAALVLLPAKSSSNAASR
jgi:MFS family permease